MTNGNTMAEMMEQMDNKSFRTPRKGEILRGKVVQVTDSEVVVNIGYKSDGIIPKSELSNVADVNPKELISEDQELDVLVLKSDDGEGNVLLSLKRISMSKDWDVLMDAYNAQQHVTVRTGEPVKGGMIAFFNDIKGFIPASQMTLSYVNNLDQFSGKEFEVEILELNKSKRKVIFSRKAILAVEDSARRETFWGGVTLNEVIVGEVKRITNFGVFVDIGGVDGLIHISELSWGRVSHPNEVVKVGDKVNVMILNANKEDNKISLSMKQATPNPWNTVEERYHVGDVVDGRVVNLTDFGAFLEIEPGVEGLVHISQISRDRIEKPSDVLKIKETYAVKIIEMNLEDRKIKLSMKSLQEPAHEVEAAHPEESAVEVSNEDDEA